MTRPAISSPASAQPMPGLSRRAQVQLRPRNFGQQPGPIAPSYRGAIPNALRSKKESTQ